MIRLPSDRAWLVRLLPELAAGSLKPLPGWTLPPDQERRLMFGAVRRYLANIAASNGRFAPVPPGALLLLDDLQWAGADALALLDALIRAASTTSLRVIAAYRDTAVSPAGPLSSWLADLAPAGLARQYALGPLGPEAAQLLDLLLKGMQSDQPVARAQCCSAQAGYPFSSAASPEGCGRAARQRYPGTRRRGCDSA